MPRKSVPRSAENFYHITARCINRDWFAMPIPDVWRVMEEQLFFIHHSFQTEIMAFTLMANHFHLVARFPSCNMGESMHYFMRQTSRSITKSVDRINQTYGGRYHRSLILTDHHLSHVYKYVYRNPVEADICRFVEDYPYSSLRGLLGQSRLLIPMIEDHRLFDSVEQTLEWLNTAPSLEFRQALSRAARKSTFSLPRCPHSKRRHPLEIESY